MCPTANAWVTSCFLGSGFVLRRVLGCGALLHSLVLLLSLGGGEWCVGSSIPVWQGRVKRAVRPVQTGATCSVCPSQTHQQLTGRYRGGGGWKMPMV